MLIPDYWEEARRVVRRPDGRERTIRRWGWSLESPEAARRHADQRVAEAADRFLAGDDVPGRIARKAYGDGQTPIREEVIARFDRHVLTRNVYGATCLNTPDAAFADIDVPEPPGCVVGVCAALAASAAGMPPAVLSKCSATARSIPTSNLWSASTTNIAGPIPIFRSPDRAGRTLE